jgi:hypothetical protein
MTAALWAAFGITFGAAVLHAAIGLTRPLDRTHLSFACLMALVATFVYFEWTLYRATTSQEAVEALRRQVIVAHGFLGFVLLFVPAYTHVRISRGVSCAFWVALSMLFVANLVAPYGVWFSGPPQLIVSTFRGEPYSAVVAPPLTFVQYVHTAYVVALVALSVGCGVIAFRRGERQRGAVIAIALIVVILHHIADVVRDAMSGSWPYVAEFGLVSWGIIMSVQLAIEFRGSEQRLHATLRRSAQHATELAAMIQTSLDVRDKLNTPLQTLELGLGLCASRGTQDGEAIARLQCAVVELTHLARAVEQTTTGALHPERPR